MQIILASYNIQYGVGKDERHDLARIVSDLGDADIIALQEVEIGNPLRDFVDQSAEIAGLLGREFWAYGPGIDLHLNGSVTGGRPGLRHKFGNMVLSRWPIQSVTNHTLPKIGLHGTLHLQRTLLETVIATPVSPLRFCCTHLDHVSPLNRMPQAEALRAIMLDAARRGGPWGGAEPDDAGFPGPLPPWPRGGVIMGDMNFEPDAPEYEHLLGDASPMLRKRVMPADGLFDAWVMTGHGEAEGWTFKRPEKQPMRLDHCFVTEDYVPSLISMRIDQEAAGSDHQPIFVTLDLGMKASR
ncbi:endonuclease/exonuclease/phosphatase family protein [Phyllobacterium zundukense]|uniref:Endonuclease/exonuclease/phosphatase family protein n=1 Tax=Phyllobacterium zundukense TaxID=1867719 RepID=A0ACD4CVE6_9HYPH|nr:endonuclease/exonuclease/phosphatase family protein [Phyllobacterium zundukense]UXN57545.1 endonuclease/exonuclease/phosphatase family protein [Phyllobacterium zundukense]